MPSTSYFGAVLIIYYWPMLFQKKRWIMNSKMYFYFWKLSFETKRFSDSTWTRLIYGTYWSSQFTYWKGTTYRRISKWTKCLNISPLFQTIIALLFEHYTEWISKIADCKKILYRCHTFLIILCRMLSKCHLRCAARSSLFQWVLWLKVHKSTRYKE